MKDSKLIQIDRLIADERFRHSIRSLETHEPIPDWLIESHHSFTRAEMELARKLIEASKTTVESTDYSNKDQIWHNIEHATIEFDKIERLSKANFKVHKHSNGWRKVMLYAAVFVGLVILSTWYVSRPTTLKNEMKALTEVVIKTNPSGQKSRITLPDGSIVHLNAESEIQYDQNFVGDQRKLYLKKGEAYFEVSKNKEKPFIVIIDDITVTALGTEFNVNAFNKDLKVALIEGSVLVNNASNNDQLILEPSDVLKFDQVSNRMLISSNNALELADWKDQILYFNDTPMNEAVETLSRWYAVEIILQNDPPKLLTVSGKFNSSSLELVLNNLSYSLDFEYRIVNKKIMIKFK